MRTTQEHPAFKVNGFLVVGFLVLFGVLIGYLFWYGITTGEPERPAAAFWVGMALALVWGLLTRGLCTIQPNEARVLVFFGRYIGSIDQDGFWWSNPLAVRKRVSLRVRNFNSEKLKVNDALGNPIIIGAVVTWKVVDASRALLDVDQFESFVNIQSETAIRTLASEYSYDAHEEGKISLRGSPDEVTRSLRQELEQRLSVAGVQIQDARISHLAYAPEIAQVMLRRQQASAVIAARQLIVEGAVGMVEMALKRLSEHNVIELDEERKAAMVSNLLVVLVSESETQPVINAGTLY